MGEGRPLRFGAPPLSSKGREGPCCPSLRRGGAFDFPKIKGCGDRKRASLPPPCLLWAGSQLTG